MTLHQCALLTYQDARPWAVAIREAVVTRAMPPWHADPHYGTFSNDPSLTEKEIAVIQAWVKGGAKEGDPKLLPAAPVFDDGWKIGKPDLVIDIGQDHKIEANGPDEYDYFTVPTSFTEDKWVTAVEIRPSNRRIVHHGHLFLGMGRDTKLGDREKAARSIVSVHGRDPRTHAHGRTSKE